MILFLVLHLQNDACAEFHIHLLEVESFYVLIENSIFRCGPINMICDITNNFESQSWTNIQLLKV